MSKIKYLAIILSMGDNNKKDRYDYVIPTSEGWKPLGETVKQVQEDLVNKSTDTTDKEIKTEGTQAFTERGIWISGKAKVLEEELERIGRETSEGINKTIATGLGELTTRGGELINRKNLFKASRVVNKSGGMAIRRERRVKDDSDLVVIDKTYPIQKDNYSKRVFMFIQYLIERWQNSPLNSEGYLVIKNLSEVARDLSDPKHKTTPARIKDYIKQISYAYPYVTTIGKKGNKKRLETEYKQPFKVKIRQLVDDGTNIGEGFITLKDYAVLDKYPFDEVWVKPSMFIRHAIGKDRYGGELPPDIKRRVEGLGNIFLTKDSIKLALDVSDLAYKIFLYNTTNRPSVPIGYQKLIEYLGYTEKDIKDKGHKGIKRDIANALKELHDKGHFKYWRYVESKQVYYWEYTNRWVKHKELIGEKVKDGGYTKGKTVQTPNKDVGEVIDQSKGERREDKVITDEDITKVKTTLITGYPKALTDIEDLEMLKTVVRMFIKDNYNSDDYWMDDNYKENFKNFMMGYLDSTDEEYLVRSLDKLRRKILTWKSYKGNWQRFKTG